MITFLIIYITGIIATVILWWRMIPSGETVTLYDIVFAILMSMFSWLSAIIAFVMEFGNTVIFRKK